MCDGLASNPDCFHQSFKRTAFFGRFASKIGHFSWKQSHFNGLIKKLVAGVNAIRLGLSYTSGFWKMPFQTRSPPSRIFYTA
jgi:hypothetical protein